MTESKCQSPARVGVVPQTLSPQSKGGESCQTHCAPNYTAAKWCFMATTIMSYYLQLQISLMVGQCWNKLLFNISLHSLLENKGHGSTGEKSLSLLTISVSFCYKQNLLHVFCIVTKKSTKVSLLQKDFWKVQDQWQLLQNKDIYG